MSDTDRADAMLAELQGQVNTLSSRCAILAADLAECRKENKELKTEAAKKNGKPAGAKP